MVKKTTIPNAWDDDDWEAQADRAETTSATSSQTSREPPKISKAERLAKHAESNKKLWDSAESPEPFHYLAARSPVPLATEFKPALTVLSRKPAPKTIARPDPITGLSTLTVEDDDDDDDEEAKKKKSSPEELRAKTQREREEKQRKYDEARAKIFGTTASTSTSTSSASTGNVTSKDGGRGSVNGKGGAANLKARFSAWGEKNAVVAEGRRSSSRSPVRMPQGQPQRELFDPNYTPRNGGGGASIDQRGSSAGRPKEESQVLRQPKAPDSSGRGGFGRSGGRGP